MEQQTIPGVDREVFERVWRRVMPEDRADCPFTLPEERALPAVPAAAPEPAADLGTGSPARSGEALRQYIDGELASWQQCRALARRLSGPAGRALAAVAGDELRHARRLSALYFLLSGVRYWPRQGADRPSTAVPAALRERYWAAHRTAETYQAAARQVDGGRQAALFTQLAKEEERHLAALQSALEQL